MRKSLTSVLLSTSLLHPSVALAQRAPSKGLFSCVVPLTPTKTRVAAGMFS